LRSQRSAANGALVRIGHQSVNDETTLFGQRRGEIGSGRLDHRANTSARITVGDHCPSRFQVLLVQFAGSEANAGRTGKLKDQAAVCRKLEPKTN
jgi:hypothetical protein